MALLREKEPAVHRVVIEIVQDCEDKSMNEAQIAQWVRHQFEGCDYGKVTVKGVNRVKQDA